MEYSSITDLYRSKQYFSYGTSPKSYLRRKDYYDAVRSYLSRLNKKAKETILIFFTLSSGTDIDLFVFIPKNCARAKDPTWCFEESKDLLLRKVVTYLAKDIYRVILSITMTCGKERLYLYSTPWILGQVSNLVIMYDDSTNELLTKIDKDRTWRVDFFRLELSPLDKYPCCKKTWEKFESDQITYLNRIYFGLGK